VVLVYKNNYVFAADNNMPAGSITPYEEMNKADNSISMKTHTRVIRRHIASISTDRLEDSIPPEQYRYPRCSKDGHWNVADNFKGIKSEQNETMKSERVYVPHEKIHPFHRTHMKGVIRGEGSLSWNTQNKEFSIKYYIRLTRL